MGSRLPGLIRRRLLRALVRDVDFSSKWFYWAPIHHYAVETLSLGSNRRVRKSLYTDKPIWRVMAYGRLLDHSTTAHNLSTEPVRSGAKNPPPTNGPSFVG